MGATSSHGGSVADQPCGIGERDGGRFFGSDPADGEIGSLGCADRGMAKRSRFGDIAEAPRQQVVQDSLIAFLGAESVGLSLMGGFPLSDNHCLSGISNNV